MSAFRFHHPPFSSRRREIENREGEQRIKVSIARFGCNRDFHLLGEKVSDDSDIFLMMEICNCAADEHQDALFEDLGDDIEDNGLPRFPTVLATLGATRSCPSVQVSHSHHY